MSDELNLAELMTVQPTGKTDEFEGPRESYGRLGIYGGHFVGQALSAGLQTVDEPKLAQSFHCYFLNPGKQEVPLIYQVQRLKEGRGVDVRTVTALQDGVAAFSMTASFKVPEQGDEHQREMPEVPSPEALQAQVTERQFQPPMMTKDRATLQLVGESFVPETFKPGREPVLQVWMKSNHGTELDDRTAQCVLAFLSDGTLMFNSVLPYGIPFQTHRLTSLDHAGWFHRPADVGQWMLYDQVSTATADGRGMNMGEVFDRSGRLIMTCMQDSMLRRMPQQS
ncbi:MAG: thioesterase family protein [Pseudomonadales bacterium]|nr:thioesterase family protein [Pseudomonadales bacterium]